MKLPSRFPLNAWHDRAALLCLALMLIVPFQHPHHFLPIPSFFAEWWAALFGLAAAACVFLRPTAWNEFPLPRILLIPAILLAALILQAARGQLLFIQPALIFAAYLIWAGLMACLGAALVRRRGLEWLADGMAAALLAGSLLEVIAMALQALNAGYGSGLMFARQSVLYGNLGQPNHLNNYLWQGIASACYLHLRGRIRWRWLLPTLSVLLLASAMTTSRSILLYAAAIGACLGLGQVRGGEGAPRQRRILWLGAALVPACLLLLFACREAVSHLLADASLQTDTLQRFYAEASSGNIRLRLWREAWQAIVAAPWQGQGFGSVPWQYFIQASLWPPGEAAPVAEHTHNLPLQLMLEFGIPVALVVLAVAAIWFIAFLRRPLSHARTWLLALLAIAGIHSLLEYPLWYTFFLGPVALLLGAADAGVRPLVPGRRGLVYGTAILFLGAAILGVLRQDYNDMERLLNWRILNGGKLDTAATVERMLKLQRDSLLSPQATVSFALMMEPARDHLEERRALCHSAMRFIPTDRLVFKCALLDAMAGDLEAAAHARQAMAAYPDTVPRFRQELETLSGVTPEVRAVFDW